LATVGKRTLIETLTQQLVETWEVSGELPPVSVSSEPDRTFFELPNGRQAMLHIVAPPSAVRQLLSMEQKMVNLAEEYLKVQRAEGPAVPFPIKQQKVLSTPLESSGVLFLLEVVSEVGETFIVELRELT